MDDVIAYIAMIHMLELTQRLSEERKPLSFGRGEYYRNCIPSRHPDDILERETSYYWFGYAEALREFVAVFNSTSIVPFTDKGKKK